MNQDNRGCTEMPPGMKDSDTIDWMNRQLDDLARYWNDITAAERDIVLDALAEELGDDYESSLSQKWSQLYTRTQQEDDEEPTYPQPNATTCMTVIKEISINKKRELARRYCDSDVSVLSDVALVRLMSDVLNGGSYARFFSIRGHIGRNFMAPVE
ncbi:hypothetical protein [uncultured Methanolobus sp.]|uniref:hypothetical protein n=1 Tax=uncultured Methanolobus sp. TaxID=218300 RepID=UPI002AAB7179|nr:hypothetical protein [uncultured Methanolobus sp.]